MKYLKFVYIPAWQKLNCLWALYRRLLNDLRRNDSEVVECPCLDTPLYVNDVKYIADIYSYSSASRKTKWYDLALISAILSHEPLSLRTSFNRSISLSTKTNFVSMKGLKIVKK